MKLKSGQVIKKFKSKKGKKVILRIVKEGDADNLMKMINSIVEEDDFVNRNKKLLLNESIKRLNNAIKDIKENKTVYLCAEADNKIIGTCFIEKKTHRQSHVGGLGIMLTKDYRGEGIGSSLMRETVNLAKKYLKPKIIILSVFETNKRGIEFYKKSGFKVCGKVPKGIFRRGKYIDNIQMYKELK